MRATPAGLLELARSLRASSLQIFLKVQFPAALPFVFAGAKVAVILRITSSASMSTLCEMASLSTLTVFRLSTGSNLVGGSTGNSFPPELPPAASAPAPAPTAAKQAKDK